MKIGKSLVEQYGPIMSHRQLSELLDRTPEALRVALRYPGELSDAINKHCKRIGRRKYYDTAGVSEFLEGSKAVDNSAGNVVVAGVPTENIKSDQQNIVDKVWRHYPRGGQSLLLALACASVADSYGAGIRHKVADLAAMTRQSERSVQRQLAFMVETGWLIQVCHAGRGRGVEYRINPQWLGL